MNELRKSLAELDTSSSVSEAGAWMERFAHQRDIAFFGYLGSGHGIDYASAPKVTNYPSAWIEEYCAGELYSVDPVRLASFSTSLPFRWEETGSLAPDGVGFADAARMLGMARDHGMHSGLTVPIVRASEQRAMMCFAGPINVSGFDLLCESHSGALYIAALHFHAVVRRLSRPGDPIRLTARERTSLGLAGQGLSTKEIARVLGVTARTAKFHVDNARKKMGASNLLQAVTFARDLDLL